MNIVHIDSRVTRICKCSWRKNWSSWYSNL